MTEIKLPLKKMKLGFAIALALVDFAHHRQAQSAKPVILVQTSTLNPSKQLNRQLIFQAPPPPPPDTGKPGRRTDTGGRLTSPVSTLNLTMKMEICSDCLPICLPFVL
ncbi:hypothetical protein F7734_33435 [Scytonema sp. UIC 10036]|uniref:hypothetical protein n=1 Tax=Scytonema sp. UIC 10036 TaxID=2304196 RepID=UPI0012DAC419|nr:hypothetical protein [Scytonema sp. UIC 10036]MUG96978.1 hypothetical protein [Scytonema sp. UIC 10036]